MTESESVVAVKPKVPLPPSATTVAAFQAVPPTSADTLLPLLLAGAVVKPDGSGMSKMPLVTMRVPVVAVNAAGGALKWNVPAMRVLVRLVTVTDPAAPLNPVDQSPMLEPACGAMTSPVPPAVVPWLTPSG